MTVDGHISQKFAKISFIASWAVLAWHCYCGSSVEKWFIPAFCYWAVPWFFFCSGFFLFNSWGKVSIQALVARKVKTLIIPYVFWCLFGLLVFLILPGFVGDVDIVRAFAIGRFDTSPAYNKSLWYLRALIIFVIICFPVRILVDNLKPRSEAMSYGLFTIIFLFIVIFVHVKLVKIYGPGSSPLYFLLGIWFSTADKYKKVERIREMVFRIQNFPKVAFISSLVCYGITRLAWFGSGYFFGSSLEEGNILGNFATLFFIVTIWFGIDFVPDVITNNLGGGVFVYFFHRPFLEWCRATIVPFFCENETMLDLLFLLLVLIYFPLCLMLAKSVDKTIPWLYSLITGGRRR